MRSIQKMLKKGFRENFLGVKYRLSPTRFRFRVLPYLWPLISSVLNFIGKGSECLPPGSSKFSSVVFLKAKSRSQSIIGIDLTGAARHWVTSSLKMKVPTPTICGGFAIVIIGDVVYPNPAFVILI